ncbi:MAG: sugar phosphate isomerase/epimerase [Candidatus Omnitrophica bacterium]|nr:sugar phosphate isomerase/epimerase [Candidatus Omnitrophota bacterium]MCA9445775.1 sugar phosphate isomerase/epimerase [Candidatus Omnitrophota bacterium]
MKKRNIQLGFDNFSIRAMKWNAEQLIEYAGSLKLDTILLSNLGVYASHDDDYLKTVKELADRNGILIHAGTNSICPTSNSFSDEYGDAIEHLELCLRVAKALGSPVLRCYQGNRSDRETDGGIFKHIEKTVEVCKKVKNQYLDAGVKIAVENHAGDMQAWELVELIEAAGKDYVGATIDAGNATWTVEDPLVSMRQLAPYAASTGIRDSAVWEIENGARVVWTNVGDGNVDWEAYLDFFEEHCPGVPIQLETISGADRPFAYLEQDFWKTYPQGRASDLAAFVAFAKKGKPYTPPTNRPTGENSESLTQQQQRFDLEESLRYCKERLGLGIKKG